MSATDTPAWTLVKELNVALNSIFAPCLNYEQLACLGDVTRAEEAYGMVSDIIDRVLARLPGPEAVRLYALLDAAIPGQHTLGMIPAGLQTLAEGMAQAAQTYSRVSEVLVDTAAPEGQPAFRVIWSIDLHADSALDAARQARAIQLRPDSTATVFDVIPSNADAERIDLDEVDAAKEPIERDPEAIDAHLAKLGMGPVPTHQRDTIESLTAEFQKWIVDRGFELEGDAQEILASRVRLQLSPEECDYLYDFSQRWEAVEEQE